MDYNNKVETKFHIGLETRNNNPIHPEEVIDLIAEYVKGGTFLESKGLWKGELENSIVFKSLNIRDMMTAEMREGLKASDCSDAVEFLKDVLETEFKQDSVLVTESKVEAAF